MKFNVKKPDEKPVEKKTLKQEPEKRSAVFGSGLTKRMLRTSANEAERELDRGVIDQAKLENSSDFALANPDPTSTKFRIKVQTSQGPVFPVKDDRKPAEAVEAVKAPAAQDLKTHNNSGVVLVQEQIDAIEGMLKQRYAVLTGRAGCGKTTCERELLRRLEAEADFVPDTVFKGRKGLDESGNYIDSERKLPNIVVCAFTGKAVDQSKRSIDPRFHPNCMTIHSAMAFYPETQTRFDEETGEYRDVRIYVPYYNEHNKMPYDTYIIEEGSFLGTELAEKFFKAMKPGVRIYIIGDINQLPPVIGKSVMGFCMLKWPTFELKTIHRQAADSPIITNAHRILEGKLPIQDDKNFVMIKLPADEVAAAQHAFLGTKTSASVLMSLTKHKLFDVQTSGAIVPTNVGILGQTELNQKLCFFFNQGADRINITGGVEAYHYAVGDKVMLLSNDNERGLTNGMMGFITAIIPNGRFRGVSENNLSDADKEAMQNFELDFDDISNQLASDFGALDKIEAEMNSEKSDKTERQASHVTTVSFDIGNGERREMTFSTAGQYRTLTHSYVFTCHKAQGSEYPFVLVMIHSETKYRRMLTREWLYTAVTRGKEKVVLLYTDRALLSALQKQAIRGNTPQEKAISFNTQLKMSPEEVAFIPEAEAI